MGILLQQSRLLKVQHCLDVDPVHSITRRGSRQSNGIFDQRHHRRTGIRLADVCQQLALIFKDLTEKTADSIDSFRPVCSSVLIKVHTQI